MNGELSGQRILLIAPRFFGYDQDIASELRRRGAEIDLLPDRPFDTPMMKAVTRFGRRFVMPAADRFYLSELERLSRGNYRAVLVINGQTLSKRVLSEIRASFPGARLILYLWDSYKNRRTVFDTLECFDDRFSFEPEAKQYGDITVRPMFFAPALEQGANTNYEYLISFVGTAHTDRYSVVRALTNNLGTAAKCYWYLYLPAKWVYFAHRLVNPAFSNAKQGEFRFSPLSRSELERVVLRSRILLEVEHPKQTGLTIRAFDAIGASRKLATTNALVRDYDFYQPENICVIDRKDPRIPSSFAETPYKSPPPTIYRKYSLAGWMDDVLAGVKSVKPPTN
jgi:hypothetical protein